MKVTLSLLYGDLLTTPISDVTLIPDTSNPEDADLARLRAMERSKNSTV